MVWEVKTLGDILSLEYGKPLDKSKRKSDGLYPAYGANGVKTRTDEFYYDKPTIIVGRKGSAGELTFSENKFWPLDVTYFVKFDENKYDLNFLYYLLNMQNLPNLATGVKPGINRNNIYALKAKTPLLEEQKRIVAILDEAFEQIDQAKTNAEQNLKNAREVFASSINSIFEDKSFGWNVESLENIAEIVNGFAFSSKDFSPKNPVKSIKITNVGVYEFINDEQNNLPLEFLDKYKNYSVRTGDLVIALTRTIIAGGLKVATVPNEYEGALLNQRVASIKVNDSVSLEILQSYLSSKAAINYVKSKVSELMQPNLSIKDLRAFPIPIPNLEKIPEISEKISNIKKLSSDLECIYKQKIQALDELKQSLLQKAFNGELTHSADGDAA